MMNLPFGAALLWAALCMDSAALSPLPADEASCTAALAALTSTSADDRERAARTLYDNCSRTILTREPATAAALRNAVESGSGAAAILLLGNFRDADSIRALRSVPAVKPVKLRLSSPPVPAQLAAAVALAHAGDSQALGLAVQTKNLAELEFLLDTLRDMEPGPPMRTLAVNALSDEREVAGGVPSGARPRRRLCDAAVDAFAVRLDLKPDFPLTPSRRYPPEQVAEARKAILHLLPR
jgi:hypothetical protein